MLFSFHEFAFRPLNMLNDILGNEEHVGKAIRESGVPREDIFVTTKLGYGRIAKLKLILCLSV